MIVNILGGLGNQMFQYAFAYSLSKRKGIEVKLDISSFDTYELREYELALFNISLLTANSEEIQALKYRSENLIQKIIRQLRRKSRYLANTYYREAHYHFDKDAYETKESKYLDGYWQSEMYFLQFRDDLLKEFSLKEPFHQQSEIFKNEIENSKSVSLHIRRGDYVTNSHTNSVHGTCSLEYYRNSVKEIAKQINNPHFFIFSDDLDWAKKNLIFIDNLTFVELGGGIPAHEELILMSLCKHNIIANSSFSWWGAWLNQNKKKIVIAPEKWFSVDDFNTKDLIPNGWGNL